MKKIISILFATILFWANAAAQFPKVDIPGSEIRKITSAVVPGQEYELHISLPGAYKNSDKRYPVIYLMDSQWDFPLVKSIYGQLYYDGFIPELIIVGVTWGGTNPKPDSLRARDYTPTYEARLKQSGGADKFLSFMKDELFPFIETNYKADSSGRTLMGCSLGGLVTLYALFTHTAMFKGYVAASPAFGWDREVMYKFEQDFYQKRSSTPARVYMTLGDVERSRPAYEKFAAKMLGRNYSFVNTRSKILENTGHSGTKAETFGRGLQHIFERPKREISTVILEKYTGLYESVTGKIEIRNEEGRLTVYFSPTNKYGLYAATETDFYSTAEFLNIHFNSPQGFELEQYGRKQSFRKKN